MLEVVRGVAGNPVESLVPRVRREANASLNVTIGRLATTCGTQIGSGMGMHTMHVDLV